MVKSLLGIIQQVAGELAQTTPSTVLSATDRTTKQFKALAVAACEELCDMHDWQRLIKTRTLSTSDGVLVYDLPADYLRMLPNTGYNSTGDGRLEGSITAREWSSRSRTDWFNNDRFRLVGNKLVFAKNPGVSPQTISFDYISSNYVWDPGLLATKAEFTTDSDETVFNPRLLTLFIKLKFLQAQGMNTQAEAEAFNMALSVAKSTDVPAPRIYVAGYDYWGPYLDEPFGKTV